MRAVEAPEHVRPKALAILEEKLEVAAVPQIRRRRGSHEAQSQFIRLARVSPAYYLLH